MAPEQTNDGLPDYIEAKDYQNIGVYLDGREVFLCEAANRAEGWVKVLVPEEGDNFTKGVPPTRPIVDDELTGVVTFVRR